MAKTVANTTLLFTVPTIENKAQNADSHASESIFLQLIPMHVFAITILDCQRKQTLNM